MKHSTSNFHSVFFSNIVMTLESSNILKAQRELKLVLEFQKAFFTRKYTNLLQSKILFEFLPLKIFFTETQCIHSFTSSTRNDLTTGSKNNYKLYYLQLISSLFRFWKKKKSYKSSYSSNNSFWTGTICISFSQKSKSEINFILVNVFF